MPSTAKQELGFRRVTADTIELANGETRAILEVQGVPLNGYAPEQAEAFLRQWAAVLNAMRTQGVQMCVWSQPGGFGRYLRERRNVVEQYALATHRDLALASVQHYDRLARHGDTRSLSFFLVVPGRKRNRTHLERDVTAYQHTYAQIGLRLRRIQEPELSLLFAALWRGDVPTHWYLRAGDWTLHGQPHGAEVRAAAGVRV